MSLAEQQATYYRDPDTGFLMMPGTRRPDGTWRKPRRIKEGYVPQDEVPLYESKGKQFAREKAAGGIPGLDLTSGLSKGILNMKIDTFDSRAAVAEGYATGASIPGLNPELVKPLHTLYSSQEKKSSKKKKSKSSSSSGANPQLLAPIPPAVNTELAPTDPAKRLRNLRKRLRDIEALENKLEQGIIAKPEPEQLEKVGRRAQVETEIEELEHSLGIS